MVNEKLYNLYLEMRGPIGAPWNLSPKNLYLEFATRDYIEREIKRTKGMKVCNIGIGAGEWDDYLGYWLNEYGELTSVDIDPENIFELRQKIEGHPNPAKVLCEDILATTLPKQSFDLVTMIGSTLKEIGNYEAGLNATLDLVADGGEFFYMDFKACHEPTDFEDFITKTDFKIINNEYHDRYPDFPFYIYQVGRK